MVRFLSLFSVLLLLLSMLLLLKDAPFECTILLLGLVCLVVRQMFNRERK